MSDAWQAAVESIRSRADLVDIIEQSTRLRRAGSSFKGLCPFHEEKTPSFMVTPSKGIYKCFGCGAGGDVFKFVMESQHLTFREAVQWLAEKYSIPLPEITGRVSSTTELDERKQALALLRYAADWYHAVLRRSSRAETARNYWQSRHFTDATLHAAQVGFGPDPSSLPESLNKRGFALELAAKYGVVRKGRFGFEDMYHGRLIFPIHDARGDVVGFGGRVIPTITPSGSPDAKYLNTPETQVFHKSALLYGQHLSSRIRNHERVILTEGYFDVLRALERGLPACAPMGTAVTEPQALRLRRMYAQVILAFDGDPAGERAARRSVQLFARIGLPVQLAYLPAGDDIDTYLRLLDDDQLAQWLRDTRPGLETILNLMMADRMSLQHRQQALQEIRDYTREISDPILRTDIAAHVSQHMGVVFTLHDDATDMAPRPAAPAPPLSNRTAAPHTPRSMWSILLTMHCTNTERRQSLLDSDACDWLESDLQSYIRGEAPMPEALLSDGWDQPELSDTEWNDLLARATVAARDEHRNSRRERLVGLIEQATSYGDTERASTLMHELQLILAAPAES